MSIVADARHLSNDDIEIDLSDLSGHPDIVFDAARQGFAEFVSEEDIDDAVGAEYDLLPIHLVGVNRLNSYLFSFEGVVSDANSVTQITAAQIEAEPEAELRPAALSFACPDGHQTRIRQQVYDARSIDVCGHEECTNSAYIDETRTRARRVVEFSVTYDETELTCIATGRYAELDHKFQNANPNADLLMTGIPRLVTTPNGSVDAVYQVLHVEPT